MGVRDIYFPMAKAFFTAEKALPDMG